MSCEETWTMRGLSGGRPLVENMRDAAVASSASAPRPYTVSVGNATGCRSRRSSAASLRASRVSGSATSGIPAANEMDVGSQLSTLVREPIVMVLRNLRLACW